MNEYIYSYIYACFLDKCSCYGFTTKQVFLAVKVIKTIFNMNISVRSHPKSFKLLNFSQKNEIDSDVKL